MYIMFTVASLCAVIVGGILLGLLARHHPDEWIIADDTMLCLVSPVMIVLSTFGGISLGWRITNGGFAAIAPEAWIGSVIIIALAIGVYFYLAPRIRRGAQPAPAAQPASTT